MKESLYDITISRKNNLRNTGGDIQGKIFKQTLSPFILQDPRYKNILLKIEDIFYPIKKNSFFNENVYLCRSYQKKQF